VWPNIYDLFKSFEVQNRCEREKKAKHNICYKNLLFVTFVLFFKVVVLTLEKHFSMNLYQYVEMSE